MLFRFFYNLLLCWTCLLAIPSVIAAPVDLLDRQAVEFSLLDYPEVQRPWFRHNLDTLDPTQKPVPWVRACFGLSHIHIDDDNEVLLKHLPQCISEARRQNLHFEWAALRYFQVKQEINSDQIEVLNPAIKALIEEVKLTQNADALAYVASSFANLMLKARISDESLPWITQANTLVDSGASKSLLVFEATKTALSTNFQYRDFQKESEAIDEEIIKRFRSLGIRKELATAVYNRGFSKIYADPPDEKGVTADLTEAMRIAAQVGNEFIIGTSTYGLGLQHGLKKEYDQAIKKVQDALAIFVKQDDHEWTIVCRLLLADYRLKTKNFSMALQVMEGLEDVMSEDEKERRNAIFWYRYKAYRGLGKLEQAMQNLEQFQKTATAISKAKENEEYNRASASIGLQLEQEKSKSLAKENELQSQQLEEANRFRIFVMIFAGLSLIVIGLLFFALRQIKRIQASRRQIKIILDNIDEGLFTVDRKRRIGVDYSHYLSNLLGPDQAIADEDFIKVIFGSSQVPTEQVAIIEQVLGASFDEERLAWELNSDNLTREYTQGDQTIAVRWIPIYSQQETMETLLVSLSDVTQARALEKALGAQEKKLRSLPDTLRELLQAKPTLIKQLLQRTADVLHEFEFSDEPQRLLQELHTQKGVARTLGLRTLSQNLHELEAAVQHVVRGDKTDLHKYLEIARAGLSEYQSFASILLQAQGPEQKLGNNLQAAIGPHLDVWIEQMQKAALPLREIRVVDKFLHWTEADLQLVQELCLHGINNSLDHGFILPNKRGVVVEAPMIAIIAQEENNEIWVEIRDNGAGLDYEKLKAVAAKRGYVPGPGETVLDVLFLDGVSTASEISLSSGRGVGLAAVKSRVLENHGRIGIQNNSQGRGTLLWARWPKDESKTQGTPH